MKEAGQGRALNTTVQTCRRGRAGGQPKSTQSTYPETLHLMGATTHQGSSWSRPGMWPTGCQA